MNVKIISPPSLDGKIGPYSAHGTRVLLDGKEVHELCDISVQYPVKGVVSVSFTVLATETLDLEENAEVHVTLQAFPGYEIIADSRDGKITYTCQKVEGFQ